MRFLLIIAARLCGTFCKAVAPMALIGLFFMAAERPACAQYSLYDASSVTYNGDGSQSVDFAVGVSPCYSGWCEYPMVDNYDLPFLPQFSYTNCNCTSQSIGPALGYYWFSYIMLDLHEYEVTWDIFAPYSYSEPCTATCCTESSSESLFWDYWDSVDVLLNVA